MFAGRWPVKYIPGWPHSSNQSDSVGIARENSIAIPTRPLHVVEAQDQSQRNMSVTAASSGRGVPIRFLRRLLHGAPASTPTRWRRKGGREGLRRCRCAGADADAPFEPPGTAPNPRFLPQLHSPSPRRSTGRSECGKRRAGCCRPGAGPGSPGDPTRRRAGLRPTVSGWEPRPPRRPPGPTGGCGLPAAPCTRAGANACSWPRVTRQSGQLAGHCPGPHGDESPAGLKAEWLQWAAATVLLQQYSRGRQPLRAGPPARPGGAGFRRLLAAERFGKPSFRAGESVIS